MKLKSVFAAVANGVSLYPLLTQSVLVLASANSNVSYNQNWDETSNWNSKDIANYFRKVDNKTKSATLNPPRSSSFVKAFDLYVIRLPKGKVFNQKLMQKVERTIEVVNRVIKENKGSIDPTSKSFYLPNDIDLRAKYYTKNLLAKT